MGLGATATTADFRTESKHLNILEMITAGSLRHSWWFVNNVLQRFVSKLGYATYPIAGAVSDQQSANTNRANRQDAALRTTKNAKRNRREEKEEIREGLKMQSTQCLFRNIYTCLT
jgi:hypothetical protein